MNKDITREAEREAFCRFCDKVIKKGWTMVSFYSHRNRGMHIHLHLECAKLIGEEAANADY